MRILLVSTYELGHQPLHVASPPAALSAAGHREEIASGPALAAVSTAGYFGFLVGPPSIGLVAEGLGLGGALYIVVTLSAVIVLLAGAVGQSGRKG